MGSIRLLFLLVCVNANAQIFKGFQTSGIPHYTINTSQTFEGFPSAFSGANPFQNNSVPANGMVAWFNPAIGITLNGSTVSSWTDVTGNYTLSQATAGNQPTYTTSNSFAKGRPALTFNGSNYLTSVNNTGVTGATPIWTFIVIWGSSAAGQSALGFGTTYGTLATGSYAIYTQGIAPYAIYTNYNSAVITTLGTSWSNTTPVLQSLEINRTDGKAYGSLNSRYRANSGNITTTLTNYSTGTFELGSWLAGGGNLNGVIMDVLIYNRTLTYVEYTAIYNYFQGLYTISN